jgi:lipid II:glycine glycyltransferase (peptidoglycan interpeptide bridge formation enzyme)
MDDFVKAHDRGDLLQLSSWAAVKEKNGWFSERIAVAKDGKTTGGGATIVQTCSEITDYPVLRATRFRCRLR